MAADYAAIVARLRAAGVAVRELGAVGSGSEGKGRVAVTLAGGRVAALAFADDAPSLFWSNPRLEEAAAGRGGVRRGDFGGDRLWFAPEVDFHWHGPPDWEGLSNYRVPPAVDPGSYRWIDIGPDVIAMAMDARLEQTDGRGAIRFNVERIVRMAPPPIAPSDPLLREVDHVGLTIEHRLRLAEASDQGRIGLWRLIQVPAGATLVAPLRTDALPDVLPYGMPGSWHVEAGLLSWQFSGQGNAKIGVSCGSSTGCAAILASVGPGRWILIVRRFSVHAAGGYGDHPHGIPRDDQVLQAWNGGGFGELEHHSPALNAASELRVLKDQDHTYAFGGSAEAVRDLAYRLIGRDVRSLMPE